MSSDAEKNSKPAFANSVVHEMAQDLVAHMLGERPVGIPGRPKNGTYYQLHFAEELIPVLDAMMEDGQDRMYRFSKFPQLAKNSLFLKISQAFQYLVDQLDDKTTLKWHKFRNEVIIRKEAAGVVIRWRKNIREALGDPDIILPEEETLSWKQKLNRFLSEAPDGSVFHEKGLSLSEEEINDEFVNLSGLKGIVFKVRSDSVKVVKLNAEDQKEL